MESLGCESKSTWLRRRLGLATLLLFLPVLVAAAPQQCSLEGRVYGLTADSHLEHGCYAPLKCPLFLAEDLSGTFRLIGAEHGLPEYREFLITDLHFLSRVEDEDWRITGSGTYARRAEVAVEHRLELDLEIDGEPEHFDSGWVVTNSDDFPNIDIRVSMNGETYQDTVLELHAIPF